MTSAISSASSPNPGTRCSSPSGAKSWDGIQRAGGAGDRVGHRTGAALTVVDAPSPLQTRNRHWPRHIQPRHPCVSFEERSSPVRDLIRLQTAVLIGVHAQPHEIAGAPAAGLAGRLPADGDAANVSRKARSSSSWRKAGFACATPRPRKWSGVGDGGVDPERDSSTGPAGRTTTLYSPLASPHLSRIAGDGDEFMNHFG